MKTPQIQYFDKNQTDDLAKLFPKDWHFDFRKFITTHFKKAYFQGITLHIEGKNIGFGNLFTFGKSAWLGNIVVDYDYRSKGYGTQITKELIKIAKNKGVETCNLIATELGKPVYEKTGFNIELNYEFYSSANNEFSFEIDKDIRKATQIDFENIQQIDCLVTGESRTEMLKFHLPCTYIAQKNGKLVGFFIDGLETGSIISADKKAGIELLKLKLKKGNTKIIIPENNFSLKEFFEENGFEKTLSLPKMVLGKRSNWLPENIYNRGAGYCG